MKFRFLIMIAALACAPLDHSRAADPVPANYSGIWWKASESGWGVAVDHRYGTIFTAFLTYDDLNRATWYFMPRGKRHIPDPMDDIDENTFQGEMYQARVDPQERDFRFPRRVSVVRIGDAGFHFDPRGGESIFWPGLPSATQAHWKSVTRLAFAGKTRDCAGDNLPLDAPGYQGMWWNAPAGSESGWGIYVAHQGDALFAIWLTYSHGGYPEWFSIELRKTGTNEYRGPIVRTTGPSPMGEYDPASVRRWTEGYATLTFTDRDNGVFTAIGDPIEGVEMRKSITRMMFEPVEAYCN